MRINNEFWKYIINNTNQIAGMCNKMIRANEKDIRNNAAITFISNKIEEMKFHIDEGF